MHDPCKCNNLVRLLADYIEHRLPPDVQQDLDQHLSRCPHCVTQLRTYASTLGLLRSLDESELPPELRLTLKAFLDRKCRN